MPTYRTTGYTLAQINAYRAVLYYEAKRCGADLNDPKSVSMVTVMAAGLNGKSALLERIARGERVMVIPPPVAMSYPWYSVVESDETNPIGLWMDAGNVNTLLEQGRTMRESFRSLMSKAEQEVQALQEQGAISKQAATKRSKNFNFFMSDVVRHSVVIEQSQWKVVAIGGDGRSLDVSMPSWLEHDVIWRLSMDVIPATESSSVIVSHHDPKGGKITTIAQLEREQRWQVAQHFKNLQAAANPALAEAMLAQAKEKDEEGIRRAGGDPASPFGSRFNRMVAESTLKACRSEIDKRLAEGKFALPDDQEIEQMVQQRIQQMLGEPEKRGSGWYTVREDGMLMCHGWRIRRLTPDVLPDSLYLDLATLEPAPERFLPDWRDAAVEAQPQAASTDEAA